MHLSVIISFCICSANIKTDKKSEKFNLTLVEKQYLDEKENNLDFMIEDPKLLCPRNTSTPKISPATSECSRESSYLDSINRPVKSPKKNIKNIERRRSLRSIPKTNIEPTLISSNDEKSDYDARHPTRNIRKRRFLSIRTPEKFNNRTTRLKENATYNLMDSILRRKEKKTKKAKCLGINFEPMTHGLENKNAMRNATEIPVPITENEIKLLKKNKFASHLFELTHSTPSDTTYYSCKEEDKTTSSEIPKSKTLCYFNESDVLKNKIKEFLYEFINTLISYYKETNLNNLVVVALQSMRNSDLFSEAECNIYEIELKAKVITNQCENNESNYDFSENSLDYLKNLDELEEINEHGILKTLPQNSSSILNHSTAYNNNSSYNSTKNCQKSASKITRREDFKQTFKMKIKKIFHNSKIIIATIILSVIVLILIFVKYYKLLVE
ncbi:hypothetical protein LUQ84_003225 [Hamiltosporidium tvaerminnensis]|nr:hypothetical protein LUQ84_003225 [Hamiltosporidium tvaerminnensis]